MSPPDIRFSQMLKVPGSSAREKCVILNELCVGFNYCINSLFHPDDLLNSTESQKTLWSPMEVLSYMKNLLLEMSANHIISDVKISHKNKNPL